MGFRNVNNIKVGTVKELINPISSQARLNFTSTRKSCPYIKLHDTFGAGYPK